MKNILIPNVNLKVFDNIGGDLAKTNLHIKADAKIVAKIAKKALSTAFKTAGSSNLDSVKIVFVETMLASLESQAGETLTSEQNALIAEAIVKGFDEIALSAAQSIEK